MDLMYANLKAWWESKVFPYVWKRQVGTKNQNEEHLVWTSFPKYVETGKSVQKTPVHTDVTILFL